MGGEPAIDPLSTPNPIPDSRILIVDSYPFLRDILRRTLLSLGMASIDTVASARPAISRCRTTHYDLILADYDLVGGKNGQQLLEDLRNEKLLPNTSGFIVLTAETARDVVLATLEHAPDDYLAKPYPQQLLVRRVKRLLKYKHALREVFESIDRDDLAAAIRAAERYLQRDQEFRGSVRRLLAQLYLRNNRLDQAQALCAGQLAVESVDWARLTQARIQQLRGQAVAAERSLLELIEANYLYIEAYDYLAELYLAEDTPEKAETIMARAVLVSPRSLARQRLYASLCERNSHLSNAAAAWREVIKLARNSRHEGPANHLSLSRALIDQCVLSDSFRDESIIGEAMSQLELLRAKFDLGADSQVQALCQEGRLLLGRGQLPRSRACLQEAGSLLARQSDSAPESLLEYAKIQSQLGERHSAQVTLERVLARYPDNPAIAAAADKILDDPVSRSGKQRIVELNRAGIASFRKGELHAARRAFAQAQARFPRNVELNLNLLQVLLALIQAFPDSERREQWLTDAEGHQRLIGELSEDHAKADHYRKLRRGLQRQQAGTR